MKTWGNTHLNTVEILFKILPLFTTNNFTNCKSNILSDVYDGEMQMYCKKDQ